MKTQINNIVILGGGSAGWLAASLLAAEHPALKITLIESTNIATIGVGEGTWPSMRNTLQRIGISEIEFLTHCDASFKQGSKFIGWKQTSSTNQAHSYYHPFMVANGYDQTNLHFAWQLFAPESSYADAINGQSHVCNHQLAPKQSQTPDYAAVTNYGYHLDATKFAQLLQQHATQKLDVKHIIDDVVEVEGEINTEIKSLITQQHGAIKADLFIDCSGIQSRLLGQHYQIKTIKQDDVLFNNKAIAVQIPYQNPQQAIQSVTLATAQPAGWIWDIGLPSRQGTGYTYSSAFCTDEQALHCLKNYVASYVGQAQAEQLSYRQLSFTAGYKAKFWHHNCVALGMASGFIEPLEASALAMIELGIYMISEQLPSNKQHMQMVAQRYNQRFEYRWQRVIEFLKLHYVLSDKTEDYWRYHQANHTIPDRLKALLELWQYQPPSRYDFIENEEIFSSASYQYILYGMGFNTQITPDSAWNNLKAGRHFIKQNQKQVAQYLAGLPSNRQLLTELMQR